MRTIVIEFSKKTIHSELVKYSVHGINISLLLVFDENQNFMKIYYVKNIQLF